MTDPGSTAFSEPTIHDSDDIKAEAVKTRIRMVEAQLSFLEARLPDGSPFAEEWHQLLAEDLKPGIERAIEAGRVNAMITTFSDAGISYEPNRQAAEGLMTSFGPGYFKGDGFIPVGLNEVSKLGDPTNTDLPRISHDEARDTKDGSFVVVDENGVVDSVILQTSIDGAPVDGIRLQLDGSVVSRPDSIAPQLRPILLVRL